MTSKSSRFVLKKKSEVWKYFIGGEGETVQCKQCLKKLKTSGNTSNMFGHLRTVHGTTVSNEKRKGDSDSAEVSKSSASTSTSTSTVTESFETEMSENENEIDNEMSRLFGKSDSEGPEASCGSNASARKHFMVAPKKQKTIDDTFNRITAFSRGGQKHNVITDSILYMLCKDYLPISTVENDGFQNLMKVAVPLYKIPSRRHFGRLLVGKYEILRLRFIEKLHKIDYVSLTTDTWTETLKTESYLGITVHLLEHTTIINATLGVYRLEESHTAVYLQRILQEALDEWNLPLEKVLSITTDNGANIVKAACDIFGKNKHIRCFAHTLNLVPEKALENVPNVLAVLQKIRRTVKWFKASVKATDELGKLQRQDGIEQLKVIQDVTTQWNATYYMIDRYIQLRKQINDVLLSNPNAPSGMVLSATEFELVRGIRQLLMPLEAATKVLSGDKYVNISKVIPITACLKERIESFESNNEDVMLLKNELSIQIQKRFGQIEHVAHFAVATLLDPRYKKLHFQDFIAAARAVELIKGYMKNNVQMDNNADPVDNVPEASNTIIPNQDGESAAFDLWDYHRRLVARNQTETPLHAEEADLLTKAELSQYLKASVVNLNVDPFVFWEQNRMVYPSLFSVARIHLRPSATSVPSERLFSKAGNTVTERRNRLSAAKLKYMLFLNGFNASDWS